MLFKCKCEISYMIGDDMTFVGGCDDLLKWCREGSYVPHSNTKVVEK
jgi:hypothetical protein